MRALWMASRPVGRVPSGWRNTADGSVGDPSNSSGRHRPSGQRSAATVVDVP
jgi:hypothetical protein